MKILFLMQDTGTVYGAERATLDLAVALQASGIAVRVLLIEEARLQLDRSALRDALSVAGLSFTTQRVGGAFSRGLIQAIRDIMREEQADVLHTIGYKADVHGVWAASRGRAFPVVSTVHGWLFRPEWKERIYAWLNLWALRRCSGVVALSAWYETYLLDRGVPREAVVRIPSGLPAQAARVPASDASDRPYTVGMMARFSSEKNHAMLIRAARRLRDAGVPCRFLLAGMGPEEATVRQAVRDAGLEEAFDWAGYMDASAFMRQVDVVVLPSHMENLPYTILEAMAAGVPVVATRVGGVPDLVEDGVTGYLVAPDEDAELGRHLISLFPDAPGRQSMGMAGRRRLEALFTMERCVEAHRALYAARVGVPCA